jgi:hypothetical protein
LIRSTRTRAARDGYAADFDHRGKKTVAANPAAGLKSLGRHKFSGESYHKAPRSAAVLPLRGMPSAIIRMAARQRENLPLSPPASRASWRHLDHHSGPTNPIRKVGTRGYATLDLEISARKASAWPIGGRIPARVPRKRNLSRRASGFVGNCISITREMSAARCNKPDEEGRTECPKLPTVRSPFRWLLPRP